MLHDKIKDDDCLSKSKTILEELTDEENRAVMPAGKITDDSDEDNDIQGKSGFHNLSPTEKIAYRLGQVNALEYVEKNISFLKMKAIETLAQGKTAKQMGYANDNQLAASFGFKLRSFQTLRKDVMVLGKETYIAMINAGYKKTDINFIAAQDVQVETDADKFYITVDNVKYDIREKELLREAFLNLKIEVANEKKKNENTKKERDLARDEASSAKDEVDRLKKPQNSIPADEIAIDQELHEHNLNLSTWINKLGKIRESCRGNKNLEDIFFPYINKIKENFSTGLGKME